MMFEDRPEVASAFQGLVSANVVASSLSSKEQHLAYIAVLAALGMTGGLPFHVRLAQQAGASDDEIVSASLVGLPAVGLQILRGHESVVATVNAESEADQ